MSRCSDILDDLENLVAEDCAGSEKEKLLAHLEECEDCRRLWQELHGDSVPRELIGGDFVASVLSRTIGESCSAAMKLIAGLPGSGLSALERSLLEHHSLHCSSCRANLELIESLTSELRQMVEFDPGPEFLDRVLEATTRAPDLPMHPSPWQLFSRFSSTLFDRPRIAWETAYTLSLAFLLILGGNLDPALAQVTQRFRLAASACVSTVGQTPRRAGALWEEASRKTELALHQRMEQGGRVLDQSKNRLRSHRQAALEYRDSVNSRLDHLRGGILEQIQSLWTDFDRDPESEGDPGVDGC